MNGTTAVRWASPETRDRGWLFVAIFAVGLLATVASVIAGDGSVAAAFAPALAVVALGSVWIVPTRTTLFGLTFLVLALDATDDGSLWQSPLAPLGRLLSENLDRTFYHPRIAAPLMAFVVGYVLVIHLHRRLTNSRVDHRSGPETAEPLSLAIACSLTAVLGLLVVGIVLRSGEPGDIQMAKNQVQNFVLLLLVAYLLAASLRGPRDYRTLGGVILTAACIKAVLALWISYRVTETLAVATTHGDSMLFASAATIVIARLAERPVRGSVLLGLLTSPLLVGAMVVNNRRLVWVEIGAAIAAVLLVGRRTRLKQALATAALLGLPLILAYVAVGWNSPNQIFAPLHVFRSVGDADLDASTLFRDMENHNLLYTLSFHTMLGTGFGHPYAEVMALPNISSVFKEYRFLPHNSILGLFAFTGALGFTGLFLALVVGVFLAARSYRLARYADERVAALAAIGTVAIYLVHCYGDIGFSERNGIFLVGPALAVAQRLAVTTGAWPRRVSASTPERVALT